MTLDGVEERFHVRERDNRVAIVLTQPGWAAATNYSYWYVSIKDLVPGEGWRWRTCYEGGGVNKAEAMRIAREYYAREARIP